MRYQRQPLHVGCSSPTATQLSQAGAARVKTFQRSGQNVVSVNNLTLLNSAANRHVLCLLLLQVVELMELGPLAGALVGSPGQSGLSVEARKRLTIGVELCANPSVIFMDEPTSGAAPTVSLLRS